MIKKLFFCLAVLTTLAASAQQQWMRHDGTQVQFGEGDDINLTNKQFWLTAPSNSAWRISPGATPVVIISNTGLVTTAFSSSGNASVGQALSVSGNSEFVGSGVFDAGLAVGDTLDVGNAVTAGMIKAYGGTNSIDPNNRRAIRSNGLGSINWESGILYSDDGNGDPDEADSVLWRLGTLSDHGNTSLNWWARSLANSNGNEVVNFNVENGGGLVFADTNLVTTTHLYTQSGVLYTEASPANRTVSEQEWQVMNGSIVVTNINAKTVGNTTLYTVPEGRQFVLERLIIIPTTVSVLATAATVSAGKTGATYGDVIGATALTGLLAASTSITLSPIVGATVLDAGEALTLRVSVGAGATTFTVKVVVVGVLL